MSVPRIVPNRADVALPPVEAVDQLDAEALVDFAMRAAALHARAMARLALVASPTPAPPADEYLTAEQVGQLLNAEPGWVYRHARQLGGVKLDGILRFSRRRVLAYIDRQHRLGG